MAKKKKKKRLRLFYPIYFTLLIAAVAVIALACARLRPYLADYELSNPKYAAEEAMRYFETRDANAFYFFADPSLFRYESRDDYMAWMNNLTEGGEFDYAMAYSAEPDVKKYNVRMNGQKFGSFTLREVAGAGEYGFPRWVFDSLETPVPEPVVYTVTAPSTAIVRAGEQVLTPANAVETGIKTEWEGHMLLETTAAPTLTRYAFSRCFGCPEVTATDASGAPCLVTGDERSGFVALRNDDLELKKQTEERVTDIVKTFSRFTSSDLSLDRMLAMARRGTKAYEVLQKFDNNWFGKHTSTKIENLCIANYIRFTEDTMACDISYDYVVNYNDGSKPYPTAYRFYLVLRDKQWYLYDFVSIAS